MAGLSCRVCQKYKQNHPDRVLLPIKFEECTRTIKQNKAKPIDKFFLVINSFLNGSGGSVIIHGDQDVHIDLLDQKVDPKLLELIPDNALYQEVYERYLLDAQHVLYRVLPRYGNRQYSVLDFNTRFSVSKGTMPPTHGQMNDFITGFRPEGGQNFIMNRGLITLIKGEHVMVTRTLHHVGNGRSTNAANARPAASVPMSENICTQAKALFRLDQGVTVAEYCWNKSKPYISAFTTIQGGGSVYIGIREEEETASRRTTGKLIAEGVSLTLQNQNEIKEFFRNKIDKELMWLGTHEHEQNVVEISFLPVADIGQPVADVYVVEVKINYYCGMCFQNPSGPELYTTSLTNGNVNTGTVIQVEDWLKTFNRHSDLLVNGRQHGAASTSGADQT